MMCLTQNKQKFWYALFKEISDVTDSAGYKTGEKAKVYYAPVEMDANISAARGSSEVEQFGINENYNRTIVTDWMDCPIDTDSKLWIGVPVSSPYNYRVVRIAKSLNSITYAISEVNAGA
jgi:hypothetical protein